MNVLKYKGYQGSVAYEDGHLIIQILHIDDIYTSELTDASKAQAAFEELVDDYLETCEAVGKEPCRPFKGSFNVRISPELHKKAAMTAASDGRSLNAWVEEAIRKHLDRRDLKPPAVVIQRIVKRRESAAGQTECFTFVSAHEIALTGEHEPEENLREDFIRRSKYLTVN